MFIYTVHLRGALYLLLRRVYILWNYCFRDTTPTTTGKRVFFFKFRYLPFFFSSPNVTGFFFYRRALAQFVTQNEYINIYIYLQCIHVLVRTVYCIYIYIIHSSSYIILYPSHILTLITVFRLLVFVRTVRFD